MTLTAEQYAIALEHEHRRRKGKGPHIDSAYEHDLIGWMVDRMGVPRETLQWSLLPEYKDHRWDGTPDPFIVIAESLQNGLDVGIESATGTGKTFFAALLVQAFLGTRHNSLAVTLAPKADQLRLHLWKEIGRKWGTFQQIFPQAALLDLTLRMRGDDPDKASWAAVGFPVGVEAGAESATKAQGFHGDHMLFVFEETPGIPKPVMTAVENTCTGDNNLRVAFGNPDSQQDALHEFCTTPGVVHVRISGYDHPNVVTGRPIIPGAVTRKAIERRRLKYGSASRLYQSRVRGISPTEAVDALIRLAWCRQAQVAHVRFASDRLRRPALGVDVANSENGDLGAIARGSGRICDSVDAFPCPNANLLGSQAVEEAKLHEIDPLNVGIDGVGVGAGAVNEAKRLDFFVQALNGGDAPRETADAEKFLNLRSQMYWQARVDLQAADVALPPDDEKLVEDLITPTWKTRNGKIIVESKEDLKKRLGRSPNKGDAFVYWNWVRDREVPLYAPSKPAHPDDEQQAIWERMHDEPWTPEGDAGEDYHQLIND